MNLNTWCKYCWPSRGKFLHPSLLSLKILKTRIISTISPILACSAPQQSIASMYKPHRGFCIACLAACLFKHDHSYAVRSAIIWPIASTQIYNSFAQHEAHSCPAVGEASSRLSYVCCFSYKIALCAMAEKKMAFASRRLIGSLARGAFMWTLISNRL